MTAATLHGYGATSAARPCTRRGATSSPATLHRSRATSGPRPCTPVRATQDNLLTYVSRGTHVMRCAAAENGQPKPSCTPCKTDVNPYRNLTAQSPKQLNHRGNQQTARAELEAGR